MFEKFTFLVVKIMKEEFYVDFAVKGDFTMNALCDIPSQVFFPGSGSPELHSVR